MIENGPRRKDPGSSIVLDPPAARQFASSAENNAGTLPKAGTVEAGDPVMIDDAAALLMVVKIG